ncbi:MAG: YggS family pyridoxal phosphate-dependent enzyme, partial [Nitrospirota bacterium]|nr:YggS family pyridoxal phosphate-dependent enzyme [Nitrospirota bacterium]
MNDITKNVQIVKENMCRAAERVGRDPQTIRLVAATKYVSVDRIRQALQSNITICGENRWQEAQAKLEEIGQPNGLVWHFLGRLQRRKLKRIVGRVALIHSVESYEQAHELNGLAQERGIQQAILLEVNVGGEETKGGFAPDALLANISTLDQLPHLRIQGFMTVPPRVANPEAARPYFRRLKQLEDEVAANHPTRVQMNELSMGMTQDYEIAIEEGATY